MRLLLDTHVWLWWVLEPGKLGIRARKHLEDSTNEVLLSAASTWEVSIKSALGRLDLPGGTARFVADSLALDGFQSLAITWEHSVEVMSLPTLHKDPFDRLLIAQAQWERVPLLSSDPLIRQYAVHLLDAES